MTRRSAAHDYSRPGIYHITMRVAEGMGSPLGKVTGDVQATDGSPDAPRVELSPVGKMVEHELLTAIQSHYPMVAVQDYVVMPEHLHFLAVVTAPLVNSSGSTTHLGQVMAGFKYGCTMKYRAMLAKRSAQGNISPSPSMTVPIPPLRMTCSICWRNMTQRRPFS